MMSYSLIDIAQSLLAAQTPIILMRIVEAYGSTPREKNAWMLVTLEKHFGTIGGGQLEFYCVGEAHKMLATQSQLARTLDIPLGPLFGQCCGGRVVLSMDYLNASLLTALRENVSAMTNTQPHIIICGAGHTGQALARALAPLPFSVTLADERLAPEPMIAAALHAQVTINLGADMDAAITAMPRQSAFIILTHNHCLDYRLTMAALERQDASYVGMIGSKTKRAKFASYLCEHHEPNTANNFLKKLTCPIGASLGAPLALPYRKEPAVIAALTVTDILDAFAKINITAIKSVTHAA